MLLGECLLLWWFLSSCFLYYGGLKVIDKGKRMVESIL